MNLKISHRNYDFLQTELLIIFYFLCWLSQWIIKSSKNAKSTFIKYIMYWIYFVFMIENAHTIDDSTAFYKEIPSAGYRTLTNQINYSFINMLLWIK